VEEGTSNEKPTAKELEDVKKPKEPYWDTKNVVGAGRNITSSESDEKPTTRHFERSKQYWDTKNVIGADRNLPSSGSFTTQDRVQTRPGCIKRLWLHYRRYWKLYTVLAIIGLAIGLPILFLVILPAIAQRLVDNANLPIHSASLLAPTPTTIQYGLVASLKIPLGVTVDLKPLNLSLYTPDTGPKDPYITVSLPEYHLKGNTTVTIQNQTAQILDAGQLEAFLSSAVDAKSFFISAYGAATAYLGILKFPLKLNKEVPLTGLNNLTGFDITNAAVVLPPLADGTNLKGSVVLPNPSIVTFELGNVTLNMIIGGITVGQGRINNILLHPGNNTIPIAATVNIKTVLQNLPLILSSQVSALKSGNLEVTASGNSTIYNGLHIPYYEQVLNKLMVSAQVPIVQILIDSLQEFLGGNSTLLGGSGGLNGTSLLTEILGILGGKSNSTAGSSLISGLEGFLRS